MYLPKVILLMVLFLYLPLSHADQYGPLRNGETLWTIAPKVKPSDTITRHQMIIALLYANPHAFRLPCNINSLKIKQTLTIPSLNEIEQISHKQALAAYNEQNTAWKAYRKQGVKIQCDAVEKQADETAPTTAQNTSPETAVATLSAQNTKDVVIVDEVVNLPKLSTPAEKQAQDIENNLALSETEQDTEILSEEIPESTEANQLADTGTKTNYLPVIIVLGVVLFVLILAFLFRDHSENKPIPEDLT